MLELDQRIRAFIDAGTTPVTADEVISDGNVADGKARYRRSVFNRRRLGLGAIGVVAVAVAASLLLVLPLTTTSIHTGIAPADASTFLMGQAAKAALEPPIVPGFGEFLYVRTLGGSIDEGGINGKIWNFYQQNLEEVWSSPSASGRTDFEVVGQPLFITGSDRAAWEAAGSPPLESGSGCCPPDVYYDITDLPTNPSRIASYLDRQQSLREQEYVPPLQKTTAFYHFDGALKFLNSGASSLQRSALLRYMATIPGVRLLGSATTLGTHKVGKVISIALGANDPYLLGPGVPGQEQAIFDPRSSKLLEIRLVGRGPIPPPAASPTNVPGPARGTANTEQVRDYSDSVFVGISSSSNMPPKAAPPLPDQWAYGTTRTPLPGSVYP